MLTKIALDRTRVILVTPDWGHSGANGSWRRLLDRLTCDRIELPDCPLYVRTMDGKLMNKPQWTSIVSVVDSQKIQIRDHELSPSLVRWVTKLNRGKGLSDLLSHFQPQPQSDEVCLPEVPLEAPMPTVGEELSVLPPLPCAEPHAVFETPMKDDVALPKETVESECALSPIAPNAFDDADSTFDELCFCASLVEEVELPPPLIDVGASVDWNHVQQILSLSGFEGTPEACPTTGFPLSRDDLKCIAEKLNPPFENLCVETLAECAFEYVYEMHVKDNIDIVKGEFDVDLLKHVNSSPEHPWLADLLQANADIFGELPRPGSSKKVVQMDIQLKPEFENAPMRGKCFKMPLEDQMEIQRQVDELVSAGLLMEYRDAEFPKYSSPLSLLRRKCRRTLSPKPLPVAAWLVTIGA